MLRTAAKQTKDYTYRRPPERTINPRRTALTDGLEKGFGLGLDREIITPASMRSILKKSKEMK